MSARTNCWMLSRLTAVHGAALMVPLIVLSCVGKAPQSKVMRCVCNNWGETFEEAQIVVGGAVCTMCLAMRTSQALGSVQWSSRDPRSGEMVAYPPAVSKQLEAAFQAGKDKVVHAGCC